MNHENLDSKKELLNIMSQVANLRDVIFYKKVLHPESVTATDLLVSDFMQRILKENIKVSDDIYYSNPFTFYIKMESEDE